jgi:hypothetical protein
MVFDINPDKPNIPSLGRIFSGMGLVSLIGSAFSLILAFSGYEWVNEIYAMAGDLGAFLTGLMFSGQAKILELLAVISSSGQIAPCHRSFSKDCRSWIGRGRCAKANPHHTAC